MTDLNAVRAQVEILQYCKERRTELADVEAQAKAAVQEALGDDDTGTLDGREVVYWRRHKRTALNQTLLAATYPEICESCKTTTEVRRFEVL